jgi:hypothetical protein
LKFFGKLATLEAVNQSKLKYLNLNQTGETRFFLQDPGFCSEVASSWFLPWFLRRVYDSAFPDRQFADGLCRSGDENVILHIVCVCVEWKKLW